MMKKRNSGFWKKFHSRLLVTAVCAALLSSPVAAYAGETPNDAPEGQTVAAQAKNDVSAEEQAASLQEQVGVDLSAAQDADASDGKAGAVTSDLAEAKGQPAVEAGKGTTEQTPAAAQQDVAARQDMTAQQDAGAQTETAGAAVAPDVSADDGNLPDAAPEAVNPETGDDVFGSADAQPAEGNRDAAGSDDAAEDVALEAPAAVIAEAESEAEGETVSDAAYRDGVYEGTGRGYEGDIVMRVTIESGRIAKIEEVSQEETPAYWKEAVVLTDTIVEKQSVDVDGVSGATRSSDGIKEAVADALSKALVPENADAFETGDGSWKSPYTIMTADQLAAFAVSVDEGETYTDTYVALGADIDVSGIESWNPIGAEGAPNSNKDKLFDGIFIGNGHTVSGMKIQGEATEQNYGLFSALNTNARISGLSVAGAQISLTATGQTRAGLVAGDTVSNNSGVAAKVDSVAAQGSITITAENDAMLFGGGILGRAMAGAVISNSWTDAALNLQAKGAGFPSSYAGGIAGMAGNNVVIVNDAAFGDVYSATQQGDTLVGYAGGLGGMFSGRMLSSYATGNITYGRASASQHTWAGALAGQLTPRAAYSGMYYASDAVLTLEAWDGDAHTDQAISGPSGSSTKNTSYQEMTEATALAKSEMSQETFAETMNATLQATFNNLRDAGLSDEVQLKEWSCTDGKVLPNGAAWYNAIPQATIFASGTGTAEDPFVIDTAEQLHAFAGSLGEKLDYFGYAIALGTDIDLSADQDWETIGEGEYSFNGTFDGCGHVIKGMHLGTAEAAAQPNMYFGLFTALDANAVVKNVSLTDVDVNAYYPKSSYIGGIAGYMGGSQTADDYTGARIDNCHVSGTIQMIQDDGNGFLGGIAAYQYKGAITNCSTDLALSGTIKGSALAEVGGLVALNNRGLIANSYSLGNVYGSGSREGDNEGMAVVSSLVAVNAGSLVGCYGNGSNTTKEFSVYAGTVSGWVTGIGKSYSCWYNADSLMTVNGEKVDPPETIGTKVPAGVSEDGLHYTGGVVDDLNGFKKGDFSTAVQKLNEKFAAYPIDITLFGVGEDELRVWTVADGVATLGTETAKVTYVQPEAENYVKPEAKLRDGVWYGRDAGKTTVVCIKVKDAAVTMTTVVSGETEGIAYEEALEKAKEKATYGDFSHYEAADPSEFDGGSGTAEDPYLISTADQLRYLAESINEDVDWEGVSFRQTADISLQGADWIPIGWGMEAEIDGVKETYCVYPFRGNYDGAGFTISDLTIGSEAEPTEMLTLGLFGITDGEYVTNDVPDESTRAVTLSNIHLENVHIYGKTQYEIYAGALLGTGQQGIVIDRCSATGVVSGETSDSHARVGGLAASVLRGKMTNCWTNTDVCATTDTGRVYAAGLVGMSNRVTIVNAYTTGSVTAAAASNNMTFAGGIDGMEGGVHINCYAAGDVTSVKTTAGIGAMNGLMGGISVNKASYFNADANLTAAGKAVEAKATGANYMDATDEAVAKTGKEMSRKAFAGELNANIDKIGQILDEVNEELEGGSHLVYYTGDGSDLCRWTVRDGVVCFEPEKNAAELKEEAAQAEAQEETEKNNAAREKNEAVAALGVLNNTVKSGDYTASTIKAYQKAYQAFLAVVKDENASVQQVQDARTAVTKAYTDLQEKGSQSVKVSVKKTAAVKYAVLKKKKQTLRLVTASGSKGAVTYSKASGSSKYVSVNAKTGVVTLAKAAPAGTHVAKVKVSAAATDDYRAAGKTVTAKITVSKAAQPMKVSAAKKTVRAAKVRKAAKTVSAVKATKAQGTVSYQKASGSKNLTVNKKTGKITVKKGTKAGKYTIKVLVKAKGNQNYKAGKKTVKVTVTVK